MSPLPPCPQSPLSLPHLTTLLSHCHPTNQNTHSFQQTQAHNQDFHHTRPTTGQEHAALLLLLLPVFIFIFVYTAYLTVGCLERDSYDYEAADGDEEDEKAGIREHGMDRRLVRERMEPNERTYLLDAAYRCVLEEDDVLEEFCRRSGYGSINRKRSLKRVFNSGDVWVGN
jgi:hypothetical protein